VFSTLVSSAQPSLAQQQQSTYIDSSSNSPTCSAAFAQVSLAFLGSSSKRARLRLRFGHKASAGLRALLPRLARRGLG